MALAKAVQGAQRPAQIITWTREDGAPEPLTGATITAKLRNRETNMVRDAAGALTVVDGAGGQFRWDYDAADVVEYGSFDVQFTAAFASGATPARTFVARWVVAEALG